jgi:hypothetical protein
MNRTQMTQIELINTDFFLSVKISPSLCEISLIGALSDFMNNSS